MTKIAVLGAGAWGTALAQHLCTNGHDTVLWGRNNDVLNAITHERINTRYLPAIKLHDNLRVCASAAQAIADVEIVLIVTPAQTVPDLIRDIDLAGKAVVLCAKGILLETRQLLTELFTHDQSIAALTGPTFAREVAMGLPTAATLACRDEAQGRSLVQTLSGPKFRLYWSDDVIGAEAAGALKNVLAIACGIVDGLGLGDNARAALITRGMAEIARYVRHKGGQSDTLMGLCGLGDIVLTCASHQSRNYSLGMMLGQGKTATSALAAMTSVAEGAPTSQAIAIEIAAHNLDMPICAMVAGLMAGRITVHEAVEWLLSRPLRTAHEGA